MTGLVMNALHVQVTDNATQKCICINGFGFNSNHGCVECQKFYRIDPETLEYIICSKNHCIDLKS